MTAKYVGDGTAIHGVPARDLTAEEYRTHKKLIKTEEKASGLKLYEVEASGTAEAVEGESE